jgi:hypothetical protein
MAHVFYGSSAGIKTQGSSHWAQDVGTVNGTAEKDDRFGWSLAAGDFNRDGFDDLAIGVPKEDVNGKDNAGYVNVLFGSGNGIDDANDQSFHQDTAGIADPAESDDHFGFSLASGDFDNDGYADLAIGSPKEDINSGGNNNDGLIHILYGRSSGLSGSGSTYWWQNAGSVNGNSEKDDHFGYSLSASDFNGDGYSDLAIGVPNEDTAGEWDTGSVNILFGRSGGIDDANDQSFHQDTDGIASSTEDDDHFGFSLTTGDFNGDGYSDLAIGVPNEDTAGEWDTGSVNILFGRSGGIDDASDESFTQDSVGVANSAEEDDRFGWAVSAGDFNGDGYSDLAVGAPKEDLNRGGNNNDGQVHTFNGNSGGLMGNNDSLYQ